MRRLPFFIGFAILLCGAAVAGATIFGTVRGIVHDAQHRPIQSATVTLKANNSEYTQTQQSDAEGAFAFTAVPLGDYTLSVTVKGFQDQQQAVMVRSESSPEIHFLMDIAGVTEKVVVSGAPVVALSDSVTPTTTLSRQDIQDSPGGDRSNSMAAITDSVPGAYMVHDMLHIRGGHQFSWMIDGVPVPNTNIATNVGPQIDPKDLDYIEVQRGSYDAEYGDRTYGVFNAVPRSGFERDRECELTASYGDYQQTNDQINCGGHTQRFAYYGSFNVNETNLGLETPVSQIIHDGANGEGGFGSLIYNIDAHNQLRMVASLRQDFFQIPNPSSLEISQPDPYSPETIVVTPMPNIFQDDSQKENDALINFSWVHTFSHQGLLTVSPFYHSNASNYDSSPNDFPNSVTYHRNSTYVGGQTTVGATVAHNTFEAGIYSFWQHDNQFFGALFNDGSNPPIQDREIIPGNLEAVFVGDKYAVTSWLTLNGGVRQTHFSGGSVSENVTSPRIGAALRIPRLNWVFRGFYGQFYQAPPLITLSGAFLGFVNTPGSPDNPQQFTPLHGERDTEYQYGVTVPYKGWTLDIDTFRTNSHNFLDHGNINYTFNGMLEPTNIYIPLSTQYALVRAWELTLKSPTLWGRGQVHLAYSNQVALFRGSITGGLSNLSFQDGWAPLDHDQRNTLSIGYNVRLPRRSAFGGNISYGSGFTNGGAGDPDFAALVPPPPQYLAPHTVVDFNVSKSFLERYSVSFNALNVTNSHLLIDDSLTFGGFHYDDPREFYGEVRIRFHY